MSTGHKHSVDQWNDGYVHCVRKFNCDYRLVTQNISNINSRCHTAYENDHSAACKPYNIVEEVERGYKLVKSMKRTNSSPCDKRKLNQQNPSHP